MGRFRKACSRIFGVLFVTAILLAMLTRILCIRDNKDYELPQPEFVFPDLVTAVLHEPELGQIYVCYNDASYVNVYTEEGDFLWAVSVPYLRHAEFVLSEGRLLIAGSEIYAYDAADGSFIGKTVLEDLEGESEPADVYHTDGYNVYRILADGSAETVVSRPAWFWITNFGVCWVIAFVCALGNGFLLLVGRARDWLQVRKKVKMETRRGRFLVRYFGITSGIQLLYAIGYIVITGMGIDYLSLSLLVVAVHFIVSNMINWNLFDGLKVTQEERKVVGFWQGAEIATFVIAFLTVVICTVITQDG